MNEKELLENVMKYQFYLLDLHLFLDTHPDCKEAQEDYKALSVKLCSAIKDYEKQCGPLFNYGLSSVVDSENWVNSKWPWENK